MRTLVKDLKEKVGESVTLYLTLDVLRDQKHLQFILHTLQLNRNFHS